MCEAQHAGSQQEPGALRSSLPPSWWPHHLKMNTNSKGELFPKVSCSSCIFEGPAPRSINDSSLNNGLIEQLHLGPRFLRVLAGCAFPESRASHLPDHCASSEPPSQHVLLLAGPQQLALSTLSLGSKVGGEEGRRRRQALHWKKRLTALTGERTMLKGSAEQKA